MKINLQLFGKIALAALVLVQFWRPERNVSNDQTHHLHTVLPYPTDIKSIFAKACDDCHSNATRYPWYAEIQPVGLWLAHHVAEGNAEWNISEFTARRAAVQNHKLEEIIEMVEDQKMPLPSYTWTHIDARLTAADRAAIIAWVGVCMDSLKSRYPADSLILKRK